MDNVNATIQVNNGAGYMRLIFENARDGYYYVRNKETGLYLDVYNAATTDGTNVHFYKQNKSDAQKWKIVWKIYKLAHYMMMTPKCAPNKWLTCDDNGVGNNNLSIYRDLTNMKQKFYVREESDNTTMVTIISMSVIF